MEQAVIRTQIQFEEGQLHRLRELAAAEGRSIADLVRESVEALLGRRGRPDPEDVRRRALGLIGRFRSGRDDLSTDHDRHLGEAFGT